MIKYNQLQVAQLNVIMKLPNSWLLESFSKTVGDVAALRVKELVDSEIPKLIWVN